MNEYELANGSVDRPPRSSVRDALSPSAPMLVGAVVSETVGGLAAVAGLWFVAASVAEPSTADAVRAVIAFAVAAVAVAAAGYLGHTGEAAVAGRLRRAVVTRLAQLPTSVRARYGDTALRRLVSEDVGALHHAVAHLPAEIATLAVVPVATVVALIVAAGPAAALTLIPAAVAASYYLFVVPRVGARFGAERAQVSAAIVDAVDDYARGVRVCRLNRAEVGAAAEYAVAVERFTTGMTTWVRRVATLAAIAVALLQAVATYAVAYTLGFGREPRELAAMLLFSLAIVTPALRLGHGIDYVRAGRVAAERIDALLAEPVSSGLETGAGPGLTARDLTVHSGDRLLVDRLTCQFREASVTAVTGRSGAGKSTLLRVLAGLEPATSGTVAAGRRPLLVPQGADVLAASVRTNLLLAAPDASDEALVSALTRAHIDVALDAPAATLSGGERQRVGLAMAFLTDAQVVLLDEPTSALDAETAEKVVDELHLLAERDGRTVIVVTHEDSIAGRADRRLDLSTPHVEITETTGELR